MSHPSLRGMETRVLAGVRTGTTFTQLFHAWRHLSTRCVSDLASQSCPSLSTHARDRHRPSSGLKPSGLDCTTRIPSKFMSVGTRCSRKRPLERRWLSNKASAGDGNSPCWKCTSPVELRQFFCDCGAAQLLDERLDYFEMFHQSPSVLVDANDIEKQFKNMQRAFHPDLFATKSAEEQAISAGNSAMINKAYQTLVRPMSRVKYLMKLLGSTAFEEHGSDDRSPAPPALLMKVMETRESLEHCSSMKEAEDIMAETRAAIDACLREMDGALKGGGGKDQLQEAAVRLRYLCRIEEEARSVIHRFEDERAKPGLA